MKIYFWETFIKLFIKRTILWTIKFSVVVHLCVEISICWWNSLRLFFNFKHQIDWYIKHTKYFLRVPPSILSELLRYHKKETNNYWKLLSPQLLPNLCQFSGSTIIKSNNFPRVSLLAVFLASHELNRWAVPNLSMYCRNKKTLLNLKLFRYLIDNFYKFFNNSYPYSWSTENKISIKR